MTRIPLLLVCICLCSLSFCQQTGRNPIIYMDAMAGHAEGNAGGFSVGISANVQMKRSLFTVRHLGTTRMNISFASVFLSFPVVEPKSDLTETAILYGWRFIENGRSFSLSLGASYSKFRISYRNSLNQQADTSSNYWGMPFEANVLWFKVSKKRFRIYGIFPVGKPTGFGGSLGFKLFGQVSRNSFVGLGLVYGLGFHKNYN